MDYVQNTDTQLDEMLQVIGVQRFEELLRTIPDSLRRAVAGCGAVFHAASLRC